MKLVETKIYLRFIFWFVIVSFLPIVALFLAIYIFNPDVINSVNFEFKQSVLFAIFISLALVLILSLIATRYLAKKVTHPIYLSVKELSKVVEELFKSVASLSEISNNNSELSQFLMDSSQAQDSGLKSGSKAVAGIVRSIDKIAKKTKSTADKTSDIDQLAVQGQERSTKALDSLNAVKGLVTENQKLTHALNQYASDVENIASRVATLADTAKFLSLNASIEASKSSFDEGFSSLIAQIRELNVTSEQAASAIGGLAISMQRQIEQSSESTRGQWEETNKTITVVSQNIKFLSKIVSNISEISKSTQVIDKETQETRVDAGDINIMIKSLHKESKSLVRHVDDIARIINKQMVLTRSLNRSSDSLIKVTNALDDLVGKQ